MQLREVIDDTIALHDPVSPQGAALRTMLEKLVHDMNNAAGTLALELFNARRVASRLELALARGEREPAGRELRELEAIRANLQEVGLKISSITKHCAAGVANLQPKDS